MRPESQPHTPVSEVAIMIRAHEIWVAAGKPNGDGRPIWLEAEQELRREAESMERNERRTFDGSVHPCHRKELATPHLGATDLIVVRGPAG